MNLKEWNVNIKDKNGVEEIFENESKRVECKSCDRNRIGTVFIGMNLKEWNVNLTKFAASARVTQNESKRVECKFV